MRVRTAILASITVLSLGLPLLGQVAIPVKSGALVRSEPRDSSEILASLDGVVEFDWRKARVVKVSESETRGTLEVMRAGVGQNPNMTTDIRERDRQVTRVSYLLPSVEQGDQVWLGVRTSGSSGWVRWEEMQVAVSRDWPVPDEAPIVVPFRKKDLPKIREGRLIQAQSLIRERAKATCEFAMLIDTKGQVAATRAVALSGAPGLETHLEPVLQSWRFGTATVDGKPAYQLVRIRFEFLSLTDRLGEKR